MSEWNKYERKALPAEMRPYQPGEDLTGVSVGDDDRKNGSPKQGDMIARDPSNHDDKWLVNAEYFEAKFNTTPMGAA